MGYSIINNRFFIKLSDREYIPMIQTSSSNWREPDGKRLARDWGVSTYVCSNGVVTNPDTISSVFDSALQSKLSEYPDVSEADMRSGYGYYTSCYIHGRRSTSFGQTKAYFINGCKQALTLEELDKQNIHIRVGTSMWASREIIQKGLTEFSPQVVKTPEEFNAVIAAIILSHGDLRYCSVEFLSEWAIERFLEKSGWQRKINKQNSSNYQWIKTNHYYAIYYPEHCGYFLKYTRSGFRYSHYPHSGKQFKTENEAVRFHRKMRSSELFEVKRINESTSFKVRCAVKASQLNQGSLTI